MKEINIGSLEFYNEIEIGDLQLDVKNIYPELEKISVKSKPNEQLIKPTKYGFSEITVEPLDIKLQSKEVEPSTEIQEIIADEEYDALNKVVVKQVTYKIDENIKPENIKNGVSILDVQGNVIELVGEEKTVKSTREQQEIYPSSGKNAITKITVEPKDVFLQDKEITENGTYEADKNYDGLGEVTVNVPSTNSFIVVTSLKGALLTCGEQSYQLTDNETEHTFTVNLGVYEVTATLEDIFITETVNVDIIGIYNCDLTKGLPTTYQEVEYLRATGTQYLKLNFTPNDFDDFKSSFIIEGRKTTMDLFGASGSPTAGASESKVFRLIESGSSQGGAFDIAFGNSWLLAQTRTFFETGTKYNVRGTMRNGLQEVYVDDVKVLSHNYSANFTTNNLMLFVLNYGGKAGPNDKVIGKVFTTEFSSYNKQYVLVPCYRKSDNKPGMYDVVNQVFYTNEGTGEFEVGGNI